jgi:hypothetical protein
LFSIIAKIGKAENQAIAIKGSLIPKSAGNIPPTVHPTNQARNILIINIIKLKLFHLLTLYK